MEQTVIDLKQARRRRIAVWTPWGAVPADQTRQQWRRKPLASECSCDDRRPADPPSKPHRRLAS